MAPGVAIILAAGTARRMGGVSKTELDLHGRTLVAHVVEGAQAAGFDPLVVAPPDLELPSGTPRYLEDPPLGGPAAGFLAAVRHSPAADTYALLAGDAPYAPRALPALLAALRPGTSTSVAYDVARADPQGGKASFLPSVVLGESLRARADALAPGGAHGLSLRGLLGELSCIDVTVADREVVISDVNTWEDLARLRERDSARQETTTNEEGSE